MTPKLCARLSALVFFVMLLLGSACRVQAQTLSYESLTNYYGVTICWEGRGYSFIAGGLTQLDEADTKAHEAKHVEQYTRFKDCKTFAKYYRTPKGKMEIEAEAYHAGWCVSIKMGADSVSRRNQFVQRIERELGGEINRLQIIQAFTKHDPCKAPK